MALVLKGIWTLEHACWETPLPKKSNGIISVFFQTARLHSKKFPVILSRARRFQCEENRSMDAFLSLQKVWNNNSELVKISWMAMLDSSWKELRKWKYRLFHLHLRKYVIWTINHVRGMKDQHISKNFIFLDMNSCLQKLWKICVSLQEFHINVEHPKTGMSLWEIYLIIYLCFMTRRV